MAWDIIAIIATVIVATYSAISAVQTAAKIWCGVYKIFKETQAAGVYNIMMMPAIMNGEAEMQNPDADKDADLISTRIFFLFIYATLYIGSMFALVVLAVYEIITKGGV